MSAHTPEPWTEVDSQGRAIYMREELKRVRSINADLLVTLEECRNYCRDNAKLSMMIDAAIRRAKGTP